MNKYDKAQFWACIILLLLMGFAGGAVTVFGIVYLFIK